MVGPGPEHLALLDFSSSRLRRELTELDATPARECYSVAVLFVSPDQREEATILANGGPEFKPCSAYQRFLAGLGWTVDLATHRGHVGGMSQSALADGPVTVYHATPTWEMIFHVATMMPGPVDLKRRLIVRDHVQVVWCEDRGDYWVHTVGNGCTKVFGPRPSAVGGSSGGGGGGGSFGGGAGGGVNGGPEGPFFYIVIYPLRTGLFRVQTVAAHGWTDTVGPLMDGAVVAGRYLPQLVRMTALQAERCAAQIWGRDPAPVARLNRIATIARAAAVDVSPQHVVASLMDPAVAALTTKKIASLGFRFESAADPASTV
jgi:hypothetical protein